MQSDLHNASFFSSISASNSRNAMTHIFSKCINVKCQTRKFSSVALDRMREPPRPLIKADADLPITYVRALKSAKRTTLRIRQLLLCSLLGNYPHCTPESRPPVQVRVLLYRMLWTEYEQHEEWMLELIGRCDELLMNAVREYMIYVIDSEPALTKHLAPLMNLPSFRKTVQSSMDHVRRYFHFFAEPTSCAYLSLANASYRPHVHEQINHRIAYAHKAILDISYQKPKLSINDMLVSERLGHPLVKVSDAEVTDEKELEALLEAQLEEEEEEEEEEDDEANAIKRAMKQCAAATTTTTTKKTKDQNRLQIMSFVGPVQYKALHDLLIRARPLEPGIMLRMAQWLEFFGVSHTTSSFVEQLIQHYHQGTMNQQRIKAKLRELQRCQPHAYNLIQVICEMIKETQEHLYLLPLPGDYIRHQLAGCRKQFEHLQEKQPDAVLDTSLEFVYCSVCETIYSLVREFGSQFRRQYKHGWRDPAVDFDTCEMYCTKNRSNHRGSCAKQPLTRITLLGKLLVWNRKLILLCPQCGHPMVLDPECAWNEKGPACQDCTTDWQARPQLYVELEQMHEKEEKRCLQCNEELANHTAYVYPFNLYMCRWHNTRALQRAVLEETFLTRDQLRTFMITFFRQRKENKHEHNLPYYKRQLQHRKMASRRMNKR